MSRLKLGIAGAGIAALQVLPHIQRLDDRLELTALADIRLDNMEHLEGRYGREVAKFGSIEEMCAKSDIDAVWVASPNHLHAEHAIIAAQHGKHVICEKPMAVTLDQCQAIVDAVEQNNVKYVQGHSKVYEVVFREMAAVIESGELGRVTHIQTSNWNDWLIRSLTPDEVNTEKGAGVVFRQGPHQADIVRFLGGGAVRSVRASAGRWDPNFPDCEGNFTAFLDFENGTVATMMFDGYGYFDVAELTWGIGEGGRRHLNADSVIPRARPPGPVSADEKYAMVRSGNPYGYGEGSGPDPSAPRKMPFFGLTMVNCERGVIRQSPDGLFVYSKEGRREIVVPEQIGRSAELVELCDAVAEDRSTFLDARWGMATAEICLAILESSRERRDILLSHQIVGPAVTAGT
jgi:phthalate 4,5-cis-dihydrodiol dehydrogenase